MRPSNLLIVLGAVALIAVLAAERLMPASGAVAYDTRSFEIRVRDYLMSHPEVARDVLAAIEARDAAAPAAATAEPKGADDSEQVTLRAALSDATPAQVAGNPHGDVTIVAFFDYRCPFCKQGIVEEKVFLAGDANARIVYRDLAILGAPSVTAARAALAAARQKKYVPFHDALMAFRGDFNDTDIFGIAMQVGLDIERLKADMQDPAITETLDANYGLARTLGVEGTPAYIVGDTVISGIATSAELQAAADAVRLKGHQAAAR
jgi:protein-disulfide isomerase